MKRTSTQPILGVGNACFEPQVLWEGPAIVNIESNAGLIIQAEATYIRTRVGNRRNVQGIDTVASHKW